jgi:mono/diheme cytochrome c family protein
VWTFAGFDAPALRDVLKSQLPLTPTPQPVETGGALTFDETIGSLLQARCSSCHGANGIQGLDLTSYQELMAGGASGPAITPGDAQNSLIVQKQSGPQAHFGQLSPAELELLIQWINQDAPEN